MRMRIGMIGFCGVLVMGISTVEAQTAVTTTGGTSGQIPVMSGSATIIDSPITVASGGNVGISMPTPLDALSILSPTGGIFVTDGVPNNYHTVEIRNDSILLSQSVGHVYQRSVQLEPVQDLGFVGLAINALDITPGGTLPGSAAQNLTMAYFNGENGNVGLGTITPSTWGAENTTSVDGTNVQIFGRSDGTGAARLVINAGGATGSADAELHLINGAAAADHRNHRFYADHDGVSLDQPVDDYSSRTLNMFWGNDGKVGIGTSTPGYSLDVNGPINTQAIRFPDGTLQTTGLSITPGIITATNPSISAINLTLNSSSVPIINFTRWVGSGAIQENASAGQFYNPFDNHFDFGIGTGISSTGDQTATTTVLTVNQAGNVGIGTIVPTADFQVAQGTTGTGTITTASTGTAVTGVGTQFLNTFKVGDAITANSETRTIETITDDTHLTTTAAWLNANSGVAYTLAGGLRFSVHGNGNVEVNGNIQLTGASPTSSSIKFADNTVQATAWNGVVPGDWAESVDVIGDRKQYEPGDVMMIDPASPDKFLKTSEPYSTMVAGIYSTKPGITGRHQTIESATWREDEVPMAIMGIVPTKVSAENGAIKPGDLLVSSSAPGYAMKGTDRDRLTGAIIGKAMGSLKEKEGIIQVLVSLQ